MITIVEGHDCAGKSTLIQNVFPNARWKHHFSKPSHKGAWVDYLAATAEYINRLNDAELDDFPSEADLQREEQLRRNGDPTQHIVIDRFIYGELIYPKVMNRSTTFTRAHARMLERVLLSHRVSLIICMAPYDTAVALWRERSDEEMIKQEDKFKEAYDAWSNLFDEIFPSIKAAFYNLESSDYADVRAKVQEKRSPENKGPGIGMYQRGVTVLVGEQVNAQVDTGGWPFVAPTGSSLWLTQQLDEIGVSEADLYWINALDRNGKETNPSFIRDMRPRKVITLGKAAELWAKRNKVDQMNTSVVAIPHPQYHKRFQSKEPYLLEEAMKP